MPLAVDPQFAAFERQYNQQEADVSADGARRQDQLRRGLARQMPQWDQDLEAKQALTGNDYLARGVFSSGHRVKDQNTNLVNDQLMRGREMGNMTDQLAGVDSDVTRQLADLRRQRAEAQLKSQQAATLGPMQTALQSMLGG